MKKIRLFIAAVIFVFCIVPISTTQAMPQQAYEGDNLAAALSVFNQKEHLELGANLVNPAFKDTVLTLDVQYPQEITLAQSGTATTTPSSGKTNPHVKRRGHGKSKMRNAGVDKDNNSQNKDSGDGEESDGENDDIENETTFGDDSAIKYNKSLKNTSGYNEDL